MKHKQRKRRKPHPRKRTALPSSEDRFASLQRVLQEGFAAHRAGNRKAAETAYRSVLRIRSDHPDANHLMGLLLGQHGEFQEAERFLRHAIESNGSVPTYHSNLANTLRAQGRLDEALTACANASGLDPNFADALHVQGLILRKQKRSEEALDCQEKAIGLEPEHLDAHSEKAMCLVELGRFREALEACDTVLAKNPQRLDALVNRGYVLDREGRPHEALETYDRALRLHPHDARAHWNRAMALLVLGDLAQGFREYEWRWKTSRFTACVRNFPQCLWDGRRLDGRTILLHTEQGLGDSIQFARYIEHVVRKGGRVVLECQAPLRNLFESLAGVDRIVTRGEPLPDFDVHAPLMSLPYLLGTTLDTIPRSVPYLRAKTMDEVRRMLSISCVHVGIVWAGRSDHVDDTRRSIALERFRPLFDLPNLQWISLQAGPRRLDAGMVSGFDRLQDPGALLEDLAGTASLVAALDLVITVDTAIAHLAGALARPVWTLLPFACDWRWLRERTDSPWYPTMRLLRQNKPGDWSGVFAQIQARLAQAPDR